MTEYGNNILEVNENIMKENYETFNVKYCEDCNRSYEMDGSKIYYHLEFPTYGLKRETCCNCN